MSNKRTIFAEGALVVSFLFTGIFAAEAAKAAQSEAVSSTVAAPADVKIESKVLVERAEQDASGKELVKTYAPTEVEVVPGDKLVFVNAYTNMSKAPVTGFAMNNPVHPAVEFTGVSENWADVSVDGGKNFGKLTALTVADKNAETGADIMRAAVPADVTDIRWTFPQAIAAGGKGELKFRGIVK